MLRRLAPSVLLAVLALAPAAHAAPAPSVRVDFAKPVQVPDLVGFTRGMDLNTPSNARIAPLRPALWRGKFADLPLGRVNELGGRYVLVLSDRWGYAPRRPPYADWARWEKFVRDTARANRRKNVIWDVWNEPDTPYFWQGTREQYFKTYEIAERVLRRELGPDVVVSGPGTFSFSTAWVTGLLDWCQATGCQVNALAWHELGGSIPSVYDHLRYANAVSSQARHSRARVGEVHVTEATHPSDQYRPGEAVAMWRYLEAGGADAAARACWDAVDGSSNCYNQSLAGLLDPRSSLPRSVWWATKAYADGSGTRRLTRSSGSMVAGLGSAASDRDRTAQVLVSHFERRPSTAAYSSAVDVDVTLRSLDRLSFLRGERRARITLERFPDTGETVLSRPYGRRASSTTIEDGTATLRLHGVKRHEAFRILISAP